MRILVLGGSQFLGLEIVWQLLNCGHEVTVISLEEPLPELRAHVAFLHVNRRDGDAMKAALAGRSYDAVVDNIAYQPEDVRLLLAALPGRIERYFLTSTVDLYGHSFPRGYAEHQAPDAPAEKPGAALGYAEGKRACEELLGRSGVPFTIVRPCIVGGRRDNVSSAPSQQAILPDEALSRSMFYPCRVLDGGPILLRDDDEGMFRLVWSVDVARAVAHLLVLPEAAGQIYNATSDEIWNAERLVLTLCHLAGRQPDLVRVSATQLAQAGLADYEPAYGHHPYWSIAENHKLRATGWRPTRAEDWMTRLLEAPLDGRARAYHERRLLEIALGQHLKRRRGATPRLVPPAPQVRPAPAPVIRRTPAAPGPWHWKKFGEQTVSGIGIGTHMGDEGPATDDRYVAALLQAVRGGINVIDTAINYRGMRSERCVGRALRLLEAEGVPRSAVLVATKGGFVPYDAEAGMSYVDYVARTYVQPGYLTPEAARHQHSLSARYLRRSLEQSLHNLGLPSVDVFFLHNPEVARELFGPKAFQQLLRDAFVMLEEQVAAGKVGAYGLATWHGLRSRPEAPVHVSLYEAVRIAREVAGESHHLRVVQLPFNVRDSEALSLPTQRLPDGTLPALRAAAALGLYTFTSGTLLQGQPPDRSLLSELAQVAPGLDQASAMLHLVRGVPEIGTALIGMRCASHVEAALEVAALPPPAH